MSNTNEAAEQSHHALKELLSQCDAANPIAPRWTRPASHVTINFVAALRRSLARDPKRLLRPEEIERLTDLTCLDLAVGNRESVRLQAIKHLCSKAGVMKEKQKDITKEAAIAALREAAEGQGHVHEDQIGTRRKAQ